MEQGASRLGSFYADCPWLRPALPRAPGPRIELDRLSEDLRRFVFSAAMWSDESPLGRKVRNHALSGLGGSDVDERSLLAELLLRLVDGPFFDAVCGASLFAPDCEARRLPLDELMSRRCADPVLTVEQVDGLCVLLAQSRLAARIEATDKGAFSLHRSVTSAPDKAFAALRCLEILEKAGACMQQVAAALVSGSPQDAAGALGGFILNLSEAWIFLPADPGSEKRVAETAVAALLDQVERFVAAIVGRMPD